MEIIREIIIAGIIIVGVLIFGWLCSVGMVWVIQWLVNEIFVTNYDINIWLGGLLLLIISSIFKN